MLMASPLPPVGAQHPFSGLSWPMLMAGLKDGTAKVPWPGVIDAQLRRIGKACTQRDPGKRPAAALLVKVCAGEGGAASSGREGAHSSPGHREEAGFCPASQG